MTILEQLADFINDSDNKKFGNTKWIADDKMQVYIRKGYHLILGRIHTCLDLANVLVLEEEQGKGLWRSFLAEAHRMNPWEATYVECVHNPILSQSLLRNGWTPNLSYESYFMVKDLK